MNNTDEEWSDWSETVIDDILQCGNDIQGHELSVLDSEESDIDISKICILQKSDIFPVSDSDTALSFEDGYLNEESFLESDDEPLVRLLKRDKAKHVNTTGDSNVSDCDEDPCILVRENFNDSDDEPLQNLKKRLSRSPSIPDDSDMDSLYRPSDYHSSSSDNNSTWNTFVQKRKHNQLSKTRKRVARHPGQVKGLGKSAPKKPRNGQEYQRNMEEAKRRSKMDSKLRSRLEQLHSQRLQNLLTANRLQLVPVSGDGNCFMASVALQTESDAVTLRQRLCDYISERKDTYLPFVNTATKEQDNAEDVFDSLVQQLRNAGCWLNDTADVLPLAVANMFNRPMKIFTSKIGLPIVNINPMDQSTQESRQPICLAYLATPGFEHYDAIDNVRPSGKNPLIGSPLKTSTPKVKKNNLQYTPRKSAMYSSPNLKQSTRKRKAELKCWKKNIRKDKRNSGQEYIDSRGKQRAKRCPQSVYCDKCKFTCTSLISEEERHELCSNYWAMGSYTQQHQYIVGSVTQCESKGASGIKRRSVSRQFSFNIGGRRIRVCKTFFLKTLNIGKKVVYTSLDKSEKGSLVLGDQRGRHTPHNKTSTTDEEQVRQHIESFPVMESHYTRKGTRRRYLHQDLSITKMHELYKESCKARDISPVSSKTYRRIFCEEYNLSFFIPKKDQCNICTVYNQRKESGTLDSNCIDNFKLHQEKKVRARLEKDNDKKKAKEAPNYSCACFDLEAILSTPCSLVSQIYYKRKLNCYNFTIYELDTKQASCYLWNESEGNRGANEIATCLLLHLKSLSPTINHVCFYSDCCAGQNRNQNVAAALLHAVEATDINVIDHKFLESGHTQMECDSVHASIEHAKKKTSIFVPHQWDTVISMARKQKPYLTIPLKHWDVSDFKTFTKDNFGQFQKDTCGNKVQWRHIRWLQFRKDEKEVIHFKTSFDEETFRCIDVNKRKLRGRQSSLKHCYSSKIPISNAKKSDLVSLCQSLVIPEEFHQYYRDLPAGASAKDCWVSESSTDTEEDI